MITEEEIVKLKRLLAKNKADNLVIIGMISDLQDDRVGIIREIMWLENLLDGEA